MPHPHYDPTAKLFTGFLSHTHAHTHTHTHHVIFLPVIFSHFHKSASLPVASMAATSTHQVNPYKTDFLFYQTGCIKTVSSLILINAIFFHAT